MWNMEWFGVVRGHRKIAPFDRYSAYEFLLAFHSIIKIF